MKPTRVLIVEDSPDDAELLVLELRRGGYAPAWRRVETAPEMGAALDEGPWDVVLSDFALPQFSAFAALSLTRQRDPDVPFLVVSGAIGEDAAAEVMRQGAADFVLKQFLFRLPHAVERELREAAARRARRATEQTVRELAAIIRCSGDAIVGTTLGGVVSSWNPGAERLYGYAAEEAVGMNVSALMPPDRPEEQKTIFGRIARGERVESFETVRLRKGGARVEVSVTVSPVVDSEGRVVGASAIARDITEKRRAEESLRRQTRLLQSVLASMADGVAGADEQGRFLVFNQAAEAILGVGPVDASPDEWPRHYGLYLPDAVTPYPADRLPLVRASKGEVVDDEEMLVRNETAPEGRWISVSGRPLVDESGGAQGGVCVFHDITDRKKAEQELARRALILSNVRDSVIFTGLDGVVTYWNEGAARLFGWSAEEMVGRPLTDRYPEAARSSVAAQIAALAAGAEWVGEHEDYRKDGSRVWIDARVTPITDAAGVPVGILGLAHDISDRKRAEAQVRLLDRAVQAVTSGIVISDAHQPDHPILFCSPGFERMTGYARGEVLGRNCRFLQGKDTDPAALAEIRSAIRDARTCDVELLNYRKDGTPFWNRLLTAPVRDEAGRLTHFVGVQTDVTERNRLAAERDALLARLQLHVERMPLACVLFDAGLRVADWNPAAEHIFGYTRCEALGTRLLDLVPQSFQEKMAEILRRVRAGDMAAHSVNEILTKDGRTITCEWFNTPLMAEGGAFTGLLCLAQDVTGRKLLEEQFRQAQKMEAVGRLAGGVAHDFNNLLTVINGYGEIVMGSLPVSHPARELVREIRDAGERAAALTRQLLAFSRKTVLEPKVLDLNALVREMASLLRRLIGEDIELVLELDPGLGRVKVDPGQLEQAVINLCVNARDAMPQGGRITVETRDVELDEASTREYADVKPGSYVLLAVADTGHGMDAATRARIFEPFFTTKPEGKGTGLGLAMVYGFIKQSSGHIAVTSAPGWGATFTLYLPRVREAVAARKSYIGLTRMPTGNETLLLVEDEEGVRALTRHVLRACGYTVVEAGDGREALRVARQHPGPVHLLISDVVMPHLGGRQVAEAVRAVHPEAKVLFLSGYTDDAVVRHGVLEAHTNFLQKPFTPASLALKVREVLDEPGGP
jgi:PAS domain S-box-containing protein